MHHPRSVGYGVRVPYDSARDADLRYTTRTKKDDSSRIPMSRDPGENCTDENAACLGQSGTYVHPMNGRAFPSNRLGEKLMTRQNPRSPGQTLTYRQLELYLMQPTPINGDEEVTYRKRLTEVKKGEKDFNGNELEEQRKPKRRLSFDELLEIFKGIHPETLQVQVPTVQQLAGVDTMVSRAYRNGKWRSNVRRTRSRSPEAREAIRVVGGESRKVKEDVPNYVSEGVRLRDGMRDGNELLRRGARHVVPMARLKAMVAGDDYRVGKAALSVLAPAYEKYMVDMMSRAVKLAGGASRVTVMHKDVYKAAKAGGDRERMLRAGEGGQAARRLLKMPQNKTRYLAGRTVRRLSKLAGIMRIGASTTSQAYRDREKNEQRTRMKFISGKPLDFVYMAQLLGRGRSDEGDDSAQRVSWLEEVTGKALGIARGRRRGNGKPNITAQDMEAALRGMR